MRICKLTEGGARRYVNACIVYHDPSESHPFHVMHDDGTHAWIAIVERSRVVHVNDPGNRGRRVTRDFTWLTPERGAREAAAAAAAAAMEPVGGAYAHALDPGPQIPPGMMLGQWNLGTYAAGSSPWGSSPAFPPDGGGAPPPLDPIPTPAIPPPHAAAAHHHHHAGVYHHQRSRLGLTANGGVAQPANGGAAQQPATGGVGRPGDWERRVLREFATDLSARPEAIQPPLVAHQTLAQAGFLAPRRETLTSTEEEEEDRAARQATGKWRRDASGDGGDEKSAPGDGDADADVDVDGDKDEDEGEIDLLAAARAVGAQLAAAGATSARRLGGADPSTEEDEEDTVEDSERGGGDGRARDEDEEENGEEDVERGAGEDGEEREEAVDAVGDETHAAS